MFSQKTNRKKVPHLLNAYIHYSALIRNELLKHSTTVGETQMHCAK